MSLGAILSISVAFSGLPSMTDVAAITVPPDGLSALDAPFVLPGCGGCDECYIQGEGWGHFTWEDPEGHRPLGEDGAHDCDDAGAGDCDEQHPMNLGLCPGGGGGGGGSLAANTETIDLPTLWFELRSADAATVRRLLTLHAEFLSYHPGSEAVQFIGCNGTVVAQLPLDDAQVAGVIPTVRALRH